MRKLYFVCCVVLLFITSCKDRFEYSPYDADFELSFLNESNLKQILKQNRDSDTLKIALFSDPHYHYEDLSDAIKSINRQSDLQFVICCGDLTETGLAKEFDFYKERIDKCNYPIISAIGNHDYRSNGLNIYQKIFGQTNFSLNYSGYKFIFFDDTVWENGNKSPKFDWLKKELANSDSIPTLVVSHIPFSTDQLEKYQDTCKSIVTENEIMLLIHGHQHTFSEEKYSSTPALIVPSVQKREYCIVKLIGKEFQIERIQF